MSMRRAAVMSAVIALLMLVGPAGPAAAQGNIQLGPFRILTSLELSGEYDDNILLTNTGKIEDFIWVISPGILIEIPAKQYSLRLGYRADILEYTTINTQLNTVLGFRCRSRRNLPSAPRSRSTPEPSTRCGGATRST
jgi:hypothetical protein